MIASLIYQHSLIQKISYEIMSMTTWRQLNMMHMMMRAVRDDAMMQLTCSGNDITCMYLVNCRLKWRYGLFKVYTLNPRVILRHQGKYCWTWYSKFCGFAVLRFCGSCHFPVLLFPNICRWAFKILLMKTCRRTSWKWQYLNFSIFGLSCQNP